MSSLVIRRHEAVYRLPRAIANGIGAVKLDEACSSGLCSAISSVSFENGDEVWLIRKVSVKCLAMAHWSSDRIAQELAKHLLGQLDRLMVQGADRQEVRWFPSRAAFVARLLVEAAEGTASKAWHFASFGALAQAECAVILEELVKKEPDTIRQAIQTLLPMEEELVRRRVSEKHAERVMRQFASIESPSADALPVVLRGLREVARALDVGVLGSFALALQLYFWALRREGSGALTEGAREAITVASLVTTLGGSPEGGVALEAWHSQQWAVLRESLGNETTARLAALEPIAPLVRNEMAATLRSLGTSRPTAAANQTYATPFGGAFILAPQLENFDWDWLAAECSSLDEHEPAQLLQFLTVASCFGPAKFRPAISDDVLRDFFGIAGSLTFADFATWLASLEDVELPARWQDCLERSGSIGRSSSVIGGFLTDGLKGIWTRRSDAPGEAEESDDEAALCVGSLLPESPKMADLLLLMSQAILREFAWRLPGFAASSVSFLRENLLNFAATIEDQDDRRIVYLGKPPLHVLLSLTGMNRRHLRPQFAGGKEWILVSR